MIMKIMVKFRPLQVGQLYGKKAQNRPKIGKSGLYVLAGISRTAIGRKNLIGYLKSLINYLSQVCHSIFSISNISPPKLTSKLAKIPKNEVLAKIGVKDEVSRMGYTGAMGMGIGVEGQQGWGYVAHFNL